MSSLSKRMSISSTRSGRSGRSESPLTRFQLAPTTDSEDWVRAWQATTARDLIDSPIEEVDADTSVEEACDLLLSRDIPCLAVKSKAPEDPHSPSSYLPYSGLFDFADVNAFLTLAATRHTFSPEHLRENPRIAKIVEAAKAGHVPVHLVSKKNPLAEVEHDASVIALLGIFSSGKHRVLIKSPTRELGGSRYLGMVSDRSLLTYFSNFAHQGSSPSSPTPSSPSLLSTSPSLLSTSPSLLSTSPALSSTSPLSPLPSSASSFLRYLSNPLSSLPLPSLNLYWEVVAVKASDSVLDAMRRMSELGVSSVAVVEEESGTLLSAVSVTDIGQIVVPSQSNQILSAPLHKLVASIKLPQGSNDGADRYPGTA
ncbi:hypothetical protein EWM64_g5315 [Hericium alpestre]|uniref:CBS domain-containing protein n=1 Tax=Hericium alpestre TaxID=135208 RepID=A0A4Y9ZUX5_9AGAM|nr:hypothetical protein EWM64_g5315 [Hericium alpestre]